MKFCITFKTPDAVEYGIEDAFRYKNESEENEELRDACEDVAEKFVRWGEMITVEFDTDNQSAKVIPVR